MTWIESVHRKDRAGRRYVVHKVRWRDPRGRSRSKTLPRGTTKKQAEAFAHKVALLKAAGDLAELDRGTETLAEFAEHWLHVYAGPNLKRSTLERYLQVWNAHIDARLGDVRLRDLRPDVLARYRADLERAGVGAPTIRKAFVVIQSMLARAVEEGRVQQNAASVVRKPSQRRVRDVVVVAPETVERICRELIEADREGRGQRDATIVRLLAYSGMRPWSEGARLPWAKVRKRTVRVYATKRERARNVDLVPSLRKDLLEWRVYAGRPPDDELVVPGSSGEAWSDSDVRNWRRRVWKPALKAVNERERAEAKRASREPRLVDESMVPYDLRHCFASLLLRDGSLSLVEVAEQLGHSVAVLSATYAHVIHELKGEPRVPADEQIRRAKAVVWAGEMGAAAV